MALGPLVALDTGADAFGNAFTGTANAFNNIAYSRERQQKMALDAQAAQQKLTDRAQVQGYLAKGDNKSLMQAAAIDPQVVEHYSKLNETQQKIVQQHNEQSAQLLNAVESTPPEQREQAFQAARQQAASAGMDLSQVPAHYDQNWSRMMINRARSMKEIFGGVTDASGNPASWSQGGGAPAPSPQAPTLQYGQGGGAAAPVAPVSSAPAPTGSLSDRIIGVESGGNPNARNPNSSASGLGQFTDGTWVQTVKSHLPMAKGMSDEEILGLKSDPNLQRQAVGWLTEDNGAALTKAGHQATDGNLYLAHFAGAKGAADILKADPNTPIFKILGEDAIQANRNVKFNGKFFPQFTAGDLQQWAAAKMGGDQTQTAAAPAAGKPVQTADLSGQTGFQTAAAQQPAPAQAAPRFVYKDGKRIEAQGVPGMFQTADGGYARDDAVFNSAMELKRAGKTDVTVDQRKENKEGEKYGELLVSNYGDITKRAAAAQEAINQISVARSLDKPDAQGNELPSQLLQRAGNIAAAIGFDPTKIPGLERISDGQSFTGVVQNLVLTKMQEQKGPQTESDAKRIVSTISSLGNTPAARGFLMDVAQAMAQRDIQQKRFYDNFRKKNGTFDGADSAWEDEISNKSIMDGLKISKPAVTTPTPAPAGGTVAVPDAAPTQQAGTVQPAGAKFIGMSDADLGAQDANRMSPEDLSAWQAEMTKRRKTNGGQDQPPAQGAQQAKDGKWYVPDPSRPGKYMRVE